eukprot:XP_001708015.1 Hypothetical protein GL50803_5357 [Giardia lamblia ATCC 50803]
MNNEHVVEFSPGYFGLYDGDELVQAMERRKEAAKVTNG